MNEKALEIFDCDSTQSVLFQELFKTPEAYQNLKRQLTENEKVEGFEFQLNRNEFENCWVAVSCRHFQDGNFVEGIVLDITENKKQLIELRRLNHELDQLIYHSSHDLRSPLTTIMGLVNLIHMDKPSPTVREYTDMIGERVAHLDNLLKDLVSITYHSKASIETEEFNFGKEVQSILADLVPTAPRINIFLSEPDNYMFLTDPVRMRTILKNLLANAFKFYNPMHTNPFVKIQLAVNEDLVCVEVTDNGVGIPDDYQKKIFEMFCKANATKGTGLGLYIVKLLAEAMGGTVAVESTEGFGSTFRVVLPIQCKTRLK
jgi:signal transduction histidine kinase